MTTFIKNIFSGRTTFTKGVAIPSFIFIMFISLFCGIFSTKASEILSYIQGFFFKNLSWVYVLMVTLFILLLLFLAFSSLGNIRLGSDNSKPRYSFFAWIAMLFAAGMGIGLMYFGVAETMAHYANPALGSTIHRAKEAQLYTFFHWGIHAWSIYAIMGLILAYFAYRYKLPLAIRSALYPILKDKINGPIGDVVDIFALCSTFFGIATTLGFGVVQLNAGLASLGIAPAQSFVIQCAIVITVMCIAVGSTLTGLDKGVKILSELNLSMAVILMLFVLFVGPTVYILTTFSEGLGYYINKLTSLTFNTFAYEKEGISWFSNWTIMYWAWWISWSPFVGLFIARISKGRTIREYIAAVLLVPSMFNFVWMTVFGSSAVWLDKFKVNGAFSALADNPDVLLFKFFDQLPMSSILSAIALLMIAVFFVTSADSGILVMNSIASNDRPNAPKWQNIFWGVLLTMVSLSLLKSGGLKSLQTMTLLSALPFGLIMLLLCYCLLKALKIDKLYYNTKLPYGSLAWDGNNWKSRLEEILTHSKKSDIKEFLTTTVKSAFEDIKEELKHKGIEAEIINSKNGRLSIELRIPYDNVRDFKYGVTTEKQTISEYFIEEDNTPDIEYNVSYHPVTYFNDGRRGNDIQYMTKKEVIVDVLREYERFLTLMADENTELLFLDN